MATNSIPRKTCNKCGKDLPATNEYFSRDPRNLYGVRAVCKSCINRAARTQTGHEETIFQVPLPLEGQAIEIPLSGNRVALIEAIDVDLAYLRWYVAIPNGKAYCHHDFQGKYKYLHRVILSRMLGRDLKKAEQVDHVNGDGLDNRRANLRLATSSQNHYNARKMKNNTSGYKGVCWNKQASKWQANINIDGHDKFLGFFETPELAHEAYCKKAVEHAGEFARFE